MYNAGLILEGGGMRGVYTAGVLDALLDSSIEVSSVYGVSAGACHGASYVSKQRGRAFRVNADYLDDKHYCGLYSYLTTGNLFGAEMLFHKIPEELDPYDHAAFAAYQGKFFVVITSVETGKAEYIQMTPELMRGRLEYIQASCSMPLVSRNVDIGGHPYLDGCIADSVPIRRSIADGNEKNIVVLTRPRGHRKGVNRELPLVKLRYRKYPEFVRCCEERHPLYNEMLDFLYAEEDAGRAFIFAPENLAGVGMLCKDREKLEALYEIGYREGMARADSLVAFLEK